MSADFTGELAPASVKRPMDNFGLKSLFHESVQRKQRAAEQETIKFRHIHIAQQEECFPETDRRPGGHTCNPSSTLMGDKEEAKRSHEQRTHSASQKPHCRFRRAMPLSSGWTL